MSAPAHITPEVKAEAAAWLARLRADDRTRADERAFQAWLQADPAHAVAFEAVTQAWEAAGALTRADRDWLERDEEPARTPLLTRRAALAAGISTLVIAGATFATLSEAYAGVYETDIGEQKHVTLDDGTQVFLDTDTRIKVAFSDRTRLVDLQRRTLQRRQSFAHSYGFAHFFVQRDAGECIDPLLDIHTAGAEPHRQASEFTCIDRGNIACLRGANRRNRGRFRITRRLAQYGNLTTLRCHHFQKFFPGCTVLQQLI